MFVFVTATVCSRRVSFSRTRLNEEREEKQKTHNKERKTESGKLYDFRKTLEETTKIQMCDSFNVRNSIPEYHHQISVTW